MVLQRKKGTPTICSSWNLDVHDNLKYVREFMYKQEFLEFAPFNGKNMCFQPRVLVRNYASQYDWFHRWNYKLWNVETTNARIKYMYITKITIIYVQENIGFIFYIYIMISQWRQSSQVSIWPLSFKVKSEKNTTSKSDLNS